jgi:TPR repeat protein
LLFIALSLLPQAGNAQTVDEAEQLYLAGDYARALVGFRRGAALGHATAQFYLGVMHADGHGVPKDDREAVRWYRLAAEQGDADAQFNLGVMHANGRGVPKNDREAVRWYRLAASQSNALAQFNLGFVHANGHGVPKDDREAVHWYRLAAEQGLAEAQFNLGVMHANARGVPKDDREAVRWYRLAAQQGLAVPQFNLGVMHATGRGVPKDDREAVRWYRLAADQDLAEAQLTLGLMYANGRGVPKDDREAVRWYRLAADQGDADAQSNLGFMYENGRGVAKDNREAVRWWRLAADQGNATAQFNLALMHANGTGVPKEDKTAYFWLLLAAAQGSVDEAQSRRMAAARDLIERRLTPQQRALAQAEARDWKPKAAESAVAISAPHSITSAATASATPDSTGTGIRIGRGMFVTNHHVIEGCRRVRINGQSAQIGPADHRVDLALLSAEVPGPIAGLRGPRALVGETISVAGYPLRGLLSGFQMTTGTLSSLSGVRGDTTRFQITAPVQAGNSGGPVLDSAGRLIGIVVSKLNALKTAEVTGDIPQNVNFAIHINTLRSFLDASGIDYETSAADKPMSGPMVARQAQGFTVLVECLGR